MVKVYEIQKGTNALKREWVYEFLENDYKLKKIGNSDLIFVHADGGDFIIFENVDN